MTRKKNTKQGNEVDTVQALTDQDLDSVGQKSAVEERLQAAVGTEVADGDRKESNEKVFPVKDVWKSYKQTTHSTGIPKGRPKSGRKWKTEQTKRFSDLRKDKPLRTSWQKKMQQKAEKKSVKKYEQELKEAREKELEIKKKRRAEKIRKKLENERKSEIVQVIKNPAKIKRMKRKQLRRIEKRDTTKVAKK
ncbi:coiled-coil domain-containing protein 86-like isoform X2 [Glandiceps talaboti]